jgi:hypothetical protein
MPGNPMDWGSIALGLIGGVGQMFGPNLDAWKRDAMINVFNQLGQQGGNAWDLYRQQQDPLFADMYMNTFGRAGNQIWNNLPQLQEQMQQFGGQIPGMFSQDALNYQSPEMMMAQQGLFGGAGGLQGTGDLAGQVFAGGGWTPGYQNLQDRGTQLMNGEDATLASAGDVGRTMLNMRGQTGQTQGIQDLMMQALGGGGANPMTNEVNALARAMFTDPRAGTNLNTLFGMGQQGMQGLFGTGGLTPTGAAGEGVALEELLAGGETPMTNAFQDFGIDQATKDQLMSPQQMMGFARDQYRGNLANQAQAARRQAAARGGGAGANVASGVQNQGLSEFANQAARGEADAVMQALLGRQSLGLEQAQQAGQRALGAGQLENARQGTAGDLMARLEQNATSRFGTSGQLASDAEQQATQRQLGGAALVPQMYQAMTGRMGTMGELGLGAGNQEVSRMDAALKAMGLDVNTRAQVLGTMGNIQQGQNQYALGAGGLQNQIAGTQGNLYNQGFNNNLAGQQFGLSRATGFGNAMNQNFGAQQGGLNFAGQLYGQGLDPLSRMAMFPGQYAQSMYTSMPGVFSNYQPGQSPMQRGFSSIANMGGGG